jgi:hypothetical protein
VCGLPDDGKWDKSSAVRLVWIYQPASTGSGAINGFNNANVNNSGCPNETTDLNYISSNFSIQAVYQPDIFNVSAPMIFRVTYRFLIFIDFKSIYLLSLG